MLITKYLLDIDSRKIHKLEFMQDGDFLKQMLHLSDTIKIFNNIHIDATKCRLNKNIKDDFRDTHCTNQQALDMIIYSDFEIFDAEEEAKKRLNELKKCKVINL